jgi:uncharacterized protein YabE (DUF348 family)
VGRTVSLILRGVIAGALVLMGVAWVATNRTVTLALDGIERQISTHATTVKGVLAAAGVETKSRDAIFPKPTAEVQDGDRIEVNRARLLTLSVDGEKRQVWVAAPTVATALEALSLRDNRMRLSSSRDTRLPLTGAILTVTTEKRVTLIADGTTWTGTTYAGTVADLLAEKRVSVQPDDKVAPPVSSPLKEGDTVVVSRFVVKRVVQTVDIAPPMQRRPDASLLKGETKTITPGRPGREEQTLEYRFGPDGKLVEKRVVSRRVLSQPQGGVLAVGTKAFPAGGDGLNWAALAKCESGGNPRAVSRSGKYRGMYQFSVSTWRRIGGSGLPDQASADEQTFRAKKLYQASGAGQWPVCGKRL